MAGVFTLLLLSLHVASATYPSDLPPTPIPRATAQPSASSDTTPPPRGRRATPVPTATGSPNPNATETPAPPQYTTLDGTWEVELQMRAKTSYSHWSLHQSGSAGADVSGVWDRGGKPPKKVTLTGTFDGRLFKFTATDGGTEYTFTGYVENYSDIVGLMNDGKGDMPFTAQHRKKEKAINQISPGAYPQAPPIPR